VSGSDGWYLTLSDYGTAVSCLLDVMRWGPIDAAVAEATPGLEWDKAEVCERPAALLLPNGPE
jgi:hypothetical protein